MPHGGRRPGSGRKPGVPQGRIKTIRSEARARVAEILRNGSDPLDILLSFANDNGLPVELRLQAASTACAYVHPKLSAATASVMSTNVTIDAGELMSQLNARLDRLTPPAPVLEHEPRSD